MWVYPIKLQPDDNGTYLVTAPDFPEVTTYGEGLSDALDRASEALEEAIAARMAGRQAVPHPSNRGKQWAAVQTQTVLKVLLYEAMQEQGISKRQLAQRLKLHRPQVDRLLNVRHATRVAALDEAFAAVGCRLVIAVSPQEP